MADIDLATRIPDMKSAMTYTESMDQIDPTVRETVISAMNEYDYSQFTAQDVQRALQAERLTIRDFQALLSPAAEPFLEDMAMAGKKRRQAFFGNSVYLFTPLYISNYCSNYCIYCGFNSHNKIHRMKLNQEQIELELKTIAATGLQEILILTGESETMSDIEYIGEACKLARKYFSVVGIEIYPTNVDSYRHLHECGCDYVTVFQETYNAVKYETLHLEGNKRVFPYRLEAQERALMGGMRGVGFAALLGLDDFRKDAFATGYHAWLLQQKYPHAEISISCPRLCPIINDATINPKDVHETQLLQVILAYRNFLPFANITISTREKARFRDHVLPLAATKISAGVSTGIGSHGAGEQNTKGEGDAQFEISDPRSVAEVFEAIKEQGMQPVMSDYIYCGKESPISR